MAINKELHTKLMAEKQFALAALVVDGFITDGKSLMAEQEANKGYFANKREIIKAEIEKHQTKAMRYLYKVALIQKHKHEESTESFGFDSWEHYTTA